MLKEYLESIKDLMFEKNEFMYCFFLYNLFDKLKNYFNKEFKIEYEFKRE